jgi:hypothetical protein
MRLPDILDKELGRLAYDERLSRYTGEVLFQGQSAAFHLESGENGGFAPSLKRAKEFFHDFAAHVQNALDYAVAQLLDLKNESWLDEGEERLTPDGFKEKMRLETVVFGALGEVTFYYGDGGLFWGRWIEIYINAQGEFEDADISG